MTVSVPHNASEPDIDAAVLDAAGNHAYSEKEAHYEMEGASSSELKDEVPAVGPGEQQQRTVTLAFRRVVADGQHQLQRVFGQRDFLPGQFAPARSHW